MTKADARHAGFTNGTVTNAFREIERLRAEGTIPPPPDTPEGKLIAEIEGSSLGDLERHAVNIVKRGATEHVQLKAIDTAAKLKMLSGNRENVGPGTPLTQEERVIRFELLRRATYPDAPNAA